jgi:hypothetical protein
VLFVSGSPFAAFITSTLYNQDDPTIVNGELEFLDVSVTEELSISIAIANYINGGFRFANYDDIITLFSAFDIEASGWNGVDQIGLAAAPHKWNYLPRL